MERIIIDCDPGVDDAIAILLAMASPNELDVMGVTTVAGNVCLENTTRNALRICELADMAPISVYPGCKQSILATPRRKPSVHGADGLGGVRLAEAITAPKAMHAIDFIIDSVLEFPGELTICALGPMTNIALALRKEPEIASEIKRIVFMGGAAFCNGNTTAAAEFNIWFDPHAAHIVVDAGVPLVMLGLDVTNQAIIDCEKIRAMGLPDSNIGSIVAEMMLNYGRKDPCLHDPCVIAYILDPSLFEGVLARVDVEHQSVLNRGRTTAAVSDKHLNGAPATCRVITSVDSEAVFRLLGRRMAKLV